MHDVTLFVKQAIDLVKLAKQVKEKVLFFKQAKVEVRLADQAKAEVMLAHQEKDEAKLVKQAKKGNNSALAELLRQNYSYLYHYSLKVTMDKNRAEDVAQDTVVKAIEKIAAFQGSAKFSTWLITIASRLIIDRARKEAREQKWLKEEKLYHAIRYDTLRAMQDWPDVLQAACLLPEHVRMPVLLKYYYQYTQQEIASMLDIPEGTVKSRIYYGIAQLRKELTVDEKTSKPR